MELAGRENLGEILTARASCATSAAKVALYFGDERYTYADLNAAAEHAASQLRANAVTGGCTVAIVLPNVPAWVAYLFGTFRVCAVVVPLNPTLTPHELLQMLRDSGARAVVTTESLASQFAHLRAESPWLPPVIPVDITRPLNCTSPAIEPTASGMGEDRAFVIFTSGTTGRAKGVVLSHRNVLANTAQVAERTALTDADRVLHIMPLFHVNGLMNNTILPLRVGASIVLRPRFDAAEFWAVVAALQPTYFTAVPTVFARLMDARDGRAQTSSVRFVRSRAAPMTPALQQQVEDRLGVPVVVSYGLSEATCTCTMNPTGWSRRTGAVGTALSGEDVVALDDAGRICPPGEVGEIAVRGPNVMVGYLNADEETARTMRGGWLHTGDMGYLDEDGFVFLTDRQKDLIIRGGENISPREVEDVLLSHPAVAEAAVVGAADRSWGEVVVAFVVPALGRSVDLSELHSHCRYRLARFKIPQRFVLVSQLPVTTVGKVDKARLRATASATEQGSTADRSGA